jgi:hypothetical protein
LFLFDNLIHSAEFTGTNRVPHRKIFIYEVYMTATIGKQGAPDNHSSRPLEQPVAADLARKERRTALKKLAVGAAAVAGCSVLPERWTAPLVEFGALPAHATTSTVVQKQSGDETASRSAASAGSGNFNLIFEMTYQSCDSCGIWFDSARLVIEHSEGTFTASQSGSLLIKQTPYRQGRFSAQISSIPSSATITKATLYMSLNRGEGIANSDSKGVITVYDNSSGQRGGVVRTITAAGDIKGRGYSKSNPTVPIDFTGYAIQVHGG